MATKTPKTEPYRPTWVSFTCVGEKDETHEVRLGLCTIEVRKGAGYWRPNLRYTNVINTNPVNDYIRELGCLGQRRFRDVKKAKAAALDLFLAVAEGLTRDVRKLVR
jgi:hypothetical protein